jgi:hypothetical protein
MRVVGYVAMAAWGVYGGMFSGGYATVLTLACVAFFGPHLLEGITVTKVVNFAGSVAATLVFVAEGRVQWGIALPMSAAAMLGGWVGAHLALRWGPQPVRRLLLAVVTGLGAKLVYDAERAWVPCSCRTFASGSRPPGWLGPLSQAMPSRLPAPST